MFSHKTKVRNRTQFRKRRLLERLEGRLMLAGDVNVGNYVLGGAAVSSDHCETNPPAVYQDSSLSGGLDTQDDSAVEEKFVDFGSDQPVLEHPDVDVGETADPEDSSNEVDVELDVDDQDDDDGSTTFVETQFSDPQEVHADSEADDGDPSNDPMIVLHAIDTQASKTKGSSDAGLSASLRASELDRFHYFAEGSVDERSEDELLSREPLHNHLRRDSFVAMSLLEPNQSEVQPFPPRPSAEQVARHNVVDPQRASEPGREQTGRGVRVIDRIFSAQPGVDQWAVATLTDEAIAAMFAVESDVADDSVTRQHANTVEAVDRKATREVSVAFDESVGKTKDSHSQQKSGVQFAALVFMSTLLTQRGGFFHVRTDPIRSSETTTNNIV
ncbi:hypothetical protein [Rhodopirellula sallentina]|uniref:Uncharacterized protein n=1 Tax=Rhodopirellula sallentina SM41 TaxID=1263870 RepID=M5TUQ7_9BACT|nr:hypothetical protein [Rhodopirellula sallentina]EMI52927.1 hypothetical protein RSSM_05654 [Rhodopirellula sallentina SM41]